MNNVLHLTTISHAAGLGRRRISILGAAVQTCTKCDTYSLEKYIGALLNHCVLLVLIVRDHATLVSGSWHFGQVEMLIKVWRWWLFLMSISSRKE